MMGPTLYALFVRDYTMKQWVCSPTDLSSSLAPKRVELRDDGNRRLFRDQWEFFPSGGMSSIIERVLSRVAVTCGAPVTVDDVDDLCKDFSAVVVTAPLDDFVAAPESWPGEGSPCAPATLRPQTRPIR